MPESFSIENRNRLFFFFKFRNPNPLSLRLSYNIGMNKGDLASGSDSGVKKRKFSSLAEQEKAYHKAMAKFFISAGVNPSTMKIPSFGKFMHLLNPSFSPSVSLVEKEVLEVHQEYKEKAKDFLKVFKGKLTLSYEWLLLGNEWTRDHIKGPVLHEDFVCMTAHFVDDDWKIKRWILGYTTDYSGPDDDINISHFRNVIQDFEIESKVSTILLPNDEDFDEETVDAIRKCIEKKGNSSINPPVFVIYCCADLFRLMVDDLFSVIDSSLLENLRMLVGWGRCSTTNWNVTLSHLQQAVDMQSEDAFSKDKIYDDYDKPSDEEWIKIKTFCKLAGCIYKVAVELFEGGYSTSNVYFHLLAELKVMLNQELANADNDYFLQKAKKIIKRFDKYWNHMFLVLATASVLDPRFKLKYLEFYCSKNQVDGEASKAETVLDYLRNLYARYEASDISEKGEEDQEDYDDEEEDQEDYDDEEEDYDEEGEGGYDSEEVEDREARKRREKKPDACKDFAFFQQFLKLEGSPKEVRESELDSYLKEPIMEWNRDCRALDWWRKESQKYPILSRVARDILSIPISRATSYEAYVSDKREPPEFTVSLEAKVANAMMCSKKWLKL